MIPKKSKEIVKYTAKEMELNEELVQDIVAFYYYKVRKNLSGMNSAVVNLEGLGTMNIRPIKLKEFIKDYKSLLTYINPKYYKNFGKIKDIESKIERLEKMEKLLEEQNIKKETTKTKKNEYQKNLERQSPNSGGDSEQSL